MFTFLVSIEEGMNLVYILILIKYKLIISFYEKKVGFRVCILDVPRESELENVFSTLLVVWKAIPSVEIAI